MQAKLIRKFTFCSGPKTTAFVLAVVSLLVSGCKSETKTTVPIESTNKADVVIADPEAEKTPEPTTDVEKQVDSKTPPKDPHKTDGQMADDQSIVISGDLNSVDWDSMVDQQVTIKGDLVIADTHDLARRGRIQVARKRLYVPTSQVDPNDKNPAAVSYEGGNNVAKVTEAKKYNESAIVMFDDGSSQQNVFPPKLFPNLGKTHRSVRVGSVVHGVVGKVVKSRGKIAIIPSEPLNWTPSERPSRASVGNLGDPDVTVASFNVLNFFTTIDDGENGARGADSKSELDRQEAKIVSAISELQADVIGLMELENNVDAEERLVTALNKAIGKEVFKGCGLPKDFLEAPGGNDEIRVGIIYRADRVSPAGEVAMIRNDAFHVARTPVVQTFESKKGGKPFSIIVNHFKSKGASKANAANKNKGDGQGAYNAARREQALAICQYIDDLDGNDPSRVLVIGDLNAYQQEDPIDALRAKGLVDLHERFGGKPGGDESSLHYSYVYYAQSGSLDHAFATDALAKDVTGVATWHINADEPRFLDYNEEYNPKQLYEPNPYRSSDHDPVLIGIRN